MRYADFKVDGRRMCCVYEVAEGFCAEAKMIGRRGKFGARILYAEDRYTRLGVRKTKRMCGRGERRLYTNK